DLISVRVPRVSKEHPAVLGSHDDRTLFRYRSFRHHTASRLLLTVRLSSRRTPQCARHAQRALYPSLPAGTWGLAPAYSANTTSAPCTSRPTPQQPAPRSARTSRALSRPPHAACPRAGLPRANRRLTARGTGLWSSR